MADHFADRYWSTAFWPVRYFQGGEQPAGAMRASLAGAATVTAGLSSTEIGVAAPGGGSGAYRFPRRIKPDWPQVYPLPIAAMMSARIKGTSSVTASATAIAEAQSRITGSSDLSATGGTIDVYAREAEFWLMAA